MTGVCSVGRRGERGRGDWTRGDCRIGGDCIIIIISDAGVCPCSSRTFILYVVTAKGVLQSYY